MKLFAKFSNPNEMEEQLSRNIKEIENFFNKENIFLDPKNLINCKIKFLLSYHLFLLKLGQSFILNEKKELLFNYLISKNFDYDKHIIDISCVFGIINVNVKNKIINEIVEIRNNFSCTHSLNKDKDIDFYESKIEWLNTEIINVSNYKMNNIDTITNINDIDRGLMFLDFEINMNQLNFEQLKRDKFKKFFNYLKNDNVFIDKFCCWLIKNNNHIGSKLIEDILTEAPNLYNEIFDKCFSNSDKYVSLITIDKIYKLNNEFIKRDQLEKITDILNGWFSQEEPYYEFSNVNSILKTDIIYKFIFEYCIHKNEEFIKKIYIWILKEGNKNKLIAFNIELFEKRIWEESESTKKIILSLYKNDRNLFDIRMKESIFVDVFNDIKKENQNE